MVATSDTSQDGAANDSPRYGIGPNSHASIPDEIDPVRQRIVEAIRRIIEGTPRLVEAGRLSVVALAEESQVSRNNLNRKYSDLRDLFMAILKELNEEEWARPVSAEQHAHLRAEYDEKNVELRAAKERGDTWKNAASVFIRKNQVLQIELKNRDRRIANLERRMKGLEQKIELLQEAPTTPEIRLYPLPE